MQGHRPHQVTHITIDGRNIGVHIDGRICRVTTVSHVNDLTLQQLDALLDQLAEARLALQAHAAQHLHQQLQQQQLNSRPVHA